MKKKKLQSARTKQTKKIVLAESRARTYTRSELKLLGWDTKHPAKGGNVLEEQEAKHFDDRFNKLLGNDRPDFLIYDSNLPRWVIECKNEKRKLSDAIRDAQFYAEQLSKRYYDVRLASAVAGNETTGVYVRNLYRSSSGKWEEVKGNNYPLTQLLERQQLNQVLANKAPSIDLDIPTESEFYAIAERVNEIFHAAKVNKSDRAVYLGSIVLSIREGNIDTTPSLILRQINANVESALDACGKSDLKAIFTLRGNSTKLKQKLPLIFHHLDRLNIRALMNTGSDVLGKFFEAFLRYGNDAKELGIVFTPRHIVSFMCDLVDISPSDVVYDPACGTGGFLVTAFSRMREQIGNKSRLLRKIKLEQIIGCDSDDSGKIPALAVVNMIFRGDGKSNVYNTDCFTFDRFELPFATKLLLNPPYAQEDEPETDFIDHGLAALKPGGLFCAIIPYAILCETNGRGWRKELLRNHHVLAVVTTPPDLFYPTNINNCILLCRAHIPHKGKTWFARITNDGFKIWRKKRIERSGSQLPKALIQFRARLVDNKKATEAEFSAYRVLHPDDSLTELVPEAYIESPPITQQQVTEDIKQLLRDFGAFCLRHEPRLRIQMNAKRQAESMITKDKTYKPRKGKLTIDQICEINYGLHEINKKAGLKEGNTLIVSSQGVENGCYGFRDYPAKYEPLFLTVPRTGSIGMAFVQEFPCSVDDNCLVLTLKAGQKLLVEEMYW